MRSPKGHTPDTKVNTHTQKSISRLPAPPNSLSPTWKVTVILSSLCSISWKHSLECAPSWILCPRAPRNKPAAITAHTVIQDESIVGRDMEGLSYENGTEVWITEDIWLWWCRWQISLTVRWWDRADVISYGVLYGPITLNFYSGLGELLTLNFH